jgi:hypothetical protein
MALALLVPAVDAQERQLTRTPRNHALDNNDNYSADDRFVCFDTRGTRVTGNGSSSSIMKVDVRSGHEFVVYAPKPIIQHPVNAAPGVIAASYNPVADEIVFIHGPFVRDTAKTGFYGKTNRRGAVTPADSSRRVKFLDYRDVDSDVTPPGAHRGGTHRHEYSRDGRRVGFTYDDQLLPEYGRTIGLLTPSKRAPGGATHWFNLLVPVVPEKLARPGDLISAAYDSWVDPQGTIRAFIGRVKETNGRFTSSLFVVDVPTNIDVTTGDAGDRTHFPKPPRGVRVRRLTRTEVSGIVRGSPDGRRIAYLAKAADGTRQVFLINTDGTNVVQATQFPTPVEAVRWHPSGQFIATITDHGVAVTDLKRGKSVPLTKHGADQPAVEGLVWSNSGKQLAFNRRIPSKRKDADGHDFQQIFIVPFAE